MEGRFTEEELQIAKSVDLTAVASSLGYEQSQKKTCEYTKEDWKRLNDGMDELLKQFSECLNENSASEKVQELVKSWQQYITETYYDCTKEVLAGLGQMYVMDERFTKNMDKYGEGTTRLISEAIAVYCK